MAKMSILLFLSVLFVAVHSIPSPNQQLSHIHSGGGNPSGYATSTYVNSTSDSSALNLLGLGVFEVMLADLAGLQSDGPVSYNGSWYSTDDGIINLSIIYKLNLVQNYSKIYLDTAPILSRFVNESVEFQVVLKACVDTHNKAAKLVELFKCGYSNITDHSGCANFTELGGTEAIYRSAVWNFSKLTAVRFWQASVELVGRSFLDDNDQKADPVYHPVQNMAEVFANRGTPPKYTTSPAAPTQLDATVLDYSLSMRPNVSFAVLNAPFAPLHDNSSVCATRFPALSTGMNAETNRWYNMMHLYAQPWHSKIRPEYAALAAAQDAKASALNISTYGQLLSALGLSSTGHANPNANPLLGGLLDVNTANYLSNNANTLNGDLPVPNMPKAIFAATFHRAHDSIVSQWDGLFSDYFTGNAAIDLLVDDQGTPLYHCYADPALGGGVCNNQSIFSFVVLTGQTYFLPLTFSNVMSYPYNIKQSDNAALSHSVGAIWAFNMYDQGYIGWALSLHTMFNEPYQGTRFADLGVTACVPELVYAGLRWYYPTSCGVCTTALAALPY